jgi:N-acyl-L-homoserine lactone synthetase
MPFTTSIVTEEKGLTEIYRLRYKVYCLEWGFEKPENHMSGSITDIFDSHSIHFAVRDDSKKTVGAIRLIVDSEEGFPIEKYCELDINKDEIPRDNIAEISRLVIHRDYRRRTEDRFIYGPDEERRSIGSFAFEPNYSFSRRFDDRQRSRQNTQRINISQTERRRRHEIVLSLYKAIYIESKRRHLSHWYSVMTKGVATLLDKFGLKFEVIGDPVDYHGIRTPYLGSLISIEEEMSNREPDLHKEFMRGL